MDPAVVERARGILLADAVAAPAKVECLKRLIQAGYGPQLRTLLDEAARVPANAPLIKDLVPAYGFTQDPRALVSLTPYFHAGTKSVVCNALRASIDLDPQQAVRLGLAAVKEAPPAAAWPADSRSGGWRRPFMRNRSAPLGRSSSTR